ncbi:Uncharacterised protein [uncultured archaeon]|nr:Uncharacterised protein [uncultured archaeon]
MYDKVVTLGDVKPVLADVAAYQLEPFITICSDVYADIVGVPFPHKWNEVKLPIFYTNSLQQDYALINPDGTSVFNIEWLQEGIVVEETNVSTLPKPWGYAECGRHQGQQTGSILQPLNWSWPTFTCNTIYNYMAYYGTWGGSDIDATFGNNPGSLSVYTDPTANNTQQKNPITQVRDTNGNLQVVTQYGTTGASQPAWPMANSPAGTVTNDGSVKWTVVDPYGTAIRISPVPSQTGVVFQFNLIAQKPPVTFTSLSQTFDPFPDKYLKYFRQGIIAQCYRWSSDAKVQAKFDKNYQIWLKSLNDLRAMEDRELEEYRFVPEQTIFGRGTSGRTSYVGPAYPFNYPWR